jgi:hypothetical protein
VARTWRRKIPGMVAIARRQGIEVVEDDDGRPVASEVPTKISESHQDERSET